jgi:hypothetical protein
MVAGKAEENDTSLNHRRNLMLSLTIYTMGEAVPSREENRWALGSLSSPPPSTGQNSEPTVL